jgi:hypothetical protein
MAMTTKEEKAKIIDDFGAALRAQTTAIISTWHIPDDFPIDRFLLRDIYWILQDYKKEFLKNDSDKQHP